MNKIPQFCENKQRFYFNFATFQSKKLHNFAMKINIKNFFERKYGSQFYKILPLAPLESKSPILGLYQLCKRALPKWPNFPLESVSKALREQLVNSETFAKNIKKCSFRPKPAQNTYRVILSWAKNHTSFAKQKL